MLDKAENPEKLIKLMIQEIEDTLVELKASCAGTMATRARLQRSLVKAREHTKKWEANARLAVEKGRDDLAREALLEKRQFLEDQENLERDAEQLSGLVDKYQSDIEQLEEKLDGARKKHRVLVQRHIQAQKRTRAQSTIRYADSTDAMGRFTSFESRIDRMEAEAELINFSRRPSLENTLEGLKTDDSIESELNALKESARGGGKDE
jgi:phage shock protein A